VSLIDIDGWPALREWDAAIWGRINCKDVIHVCREPRAVRWEEAAAGLNRTL